MNIRTLKGFRDFLPKEAKRREYVINTLRKVFELYGFEPLETPSLEYEEILTGKYGEEGEKLMYRFEDNGKRKVAMRYDQTVPLARVVAEYQNELPLPFKRYQIQNVWRADNTQKGRYREFLQCDADIVGSSSPQSDVEIISLTIKCLEKLNLKNFKILINDRRVFKSNETSLGTWLPEGIGPKEASKMDSIIIRAVDKLGKIGEEKVIEEIVSKTIYNKDQAEKWIAELKGKKINSSLQDIFKALEKMGIDKRVLEFRPTLARGLDYYTGLIFEIEIEGYNGGSVAGGGRYDKLIGIFSKKDIPAVGVAFGFDRLIEAMEELKLFPAGLSVTKVLVTNGGKKSLEIAGTLRENNINTEIYPDEKDLEKQLKYADKKDIPYVIIENESGLILKDMIRRTQETLTLEEILKKLE